MKKVVCIALVTLSFGYAGCGFLDKEERRTETILPDGRVVETVVDTYKGEKYLDAAKKGAEVARDSGIPLVNAVGFGMTLLLGTATAVLGKVAANRNNVTKAVVVGVEEAAKNYEEVKRGVIKIAETFNPEVAEKIRREFDKYQTTKEMVEKISAMQGTQFLVDSIVQNILKSYGRTT